MSLGQLGPGMGDLVFGSHFNSNVDDFSGHGYNATGIYTSYDAPSGILGPGVKMNGSNSRIYCPNSVASVIRDSSYTVAVLVSLPAAAPSTQPIFGQCWCSVYDEDWGATRHYGTALMIYATSLYFQRNDGNTTQRYFSIPFEFESSKKYLIGLTVSEASPGIACLYVIPLFPGKAKGYGTSVIGNINVLVDAFHDQGLNIGANVRNASNQFGTHTLNEFLLFNTVKPMSWFMEYAALLRGFK